MTYRISFVISFVILFWGNDFEVIDTKTLIQKYEHSVKASRVSQRDDKKLLTNWTDEYQVRRLNISVKYRLQMVKHEEHNFKSDGNFRWENCLHVHSNELRNTKRLYYENELVCLRTSSSKDIGKKEDIEKLEKEIVKWRRGFRYLKNKCLVENPKNQVNSQECLIQYMQNDKYDQVIDRLMLLKSSAISDLFYYYNSSLLLLEECLRNLLSSYIDKIRVLMNTLHKCYNINS